jgi:hypothetical protein
VRILRTVPPDHLAESFSFVLGQAVKHPGAPERITRRGVLGVRLAEHARQADGPANAQSA